MKPILHRWHSLVWLPALVLCLHLSACQSGNREVAASLDRIEQVVEQHPDSALIELVRLDSLLDAGAVHIDGDRQMARYALLKTQTHDKNYIDDTSDSLINRAVSYYDEHGSKREQMLAHFYHGAIFRNAKDYGAAFFAYRQAENLAKELEDDHYLALIYGNLTTVCQATYSKDAVFYAKKDLAFAQKSRNHREIISAKADLARTYSQNLEYDSSEVLFQELLHSLPSTDAIVQYCLPFYIEQCVVSERYVLADSLVKLQQVKTGLSYLLNKACLFQIKGMSDSTSLYIQRAEHEIHTLEDQAFYYESLSWIAEMNGDLGLALKLKKERVRTLNKVVTSLFSKTVSDYQRDFETQQKVIAEYRLKTFKGQSLLASILVMLAIAGLLVYLFGLIKKRNQLLEDAIAHNVEQSLMLGRDEITLGELRTQIAVLERNLVEAKAVTISKRLSLLLSKHFNLYNRLGYVLFKTQKQIGQSKTIFELVEKEMKHLYANGKVIAEIDHIIDETFDGAMTKAKSSELRLGEDDIRLLRFMLIRLSSSTIAYLFDKDQEIIYKRKYRLKEKLKHQTCKNASDIVALLEEYKEGDNEDQNAEIK